jgi:hypothetical protein
LYVELPAALGTVLVEHRRKRRTIGGRTPSRMKTTTATKSSPRKSATGRRRRAELGRDEARPTAPMIKRHRRAAADGDQIKICVEKRKSNSCDGRTPRSSRTFPAPAASSRRRRTRSASSTRRRQRTHLSLSRIAHDRPKSLRTRTSAPAATTTRTTADT